MFDFYTGPVVSGEPVIQHTLRCDAMVKIRKGVYRQCFKVPEFSASIADNRGYSKSICFTHRNANNITFAVLGMTQLYDVGIYVQATGRYIYHRVRLSDAEVADLKVEFARLFGEDRVGYTEIKLLKIQLCEREEFFSFVKELDTSPVREVDPAVIERVAEREATSKAKKPRGRIARP